MFKLKKPDQSFWGCIDRVRFGPRDQINDFFIVGDWNKVYHYNGSTVRKYPELFLDGYSFGIYHYNNHVFVAGATGSSFRAVVFRGVR